MAKTPARRRSLERWRRSTAARGTSSRSTDKLTAIEWIGGFFVLLGVAPSIVFALNVLLGRRNAHAYGAGDAPWSALDPVSHVITVMIALTSAARALSHDFAPGQYAAVFLGTMVALIVILLLRDIIEARRRNKGGA